PYTKRFTWLCHAWLGASLAMSVPAAALAMRPEAVALPVVWWLAGMVLLWVTGFDVIYALQDVETDRCEGLFSMPARLGVSRSLVLSLAMHVGAVACLVQAWRVEPRLGAPFAVAVGLVIGLLAVEHATVRRWGTTRMALTFFTLNGCVSLLLGTAGILGLAGVGR
ncbi:MAG: UbiA family prenyltransferase, partial [Planctomycetota bacterium]